LEEAEAYLAEMDDIELDRKQLKAVTSGRFPFDRNCNFKEEFLWEN